MRFTLGAAVLIAAVAGNSNKDDIRGILKDTKDTWKSGLIPVSRTENTQNDMFYWLFDSRASPDTDPLVVWLTGGPGCASEVALFYENGPYKFPEDVTKLSPITTNAYSWNNSANLLYVDQPIGTGFSHAKPGAGARSEEQVAEDFYEFLAGFVEQNPQFEGRDFYITGESYAGHYIPAIGSYIVKQGADFDLNLKGLAIGNGLTDPFIQYPQYSTFSHENDLISDQWSKVLDVGFKACQGLIWAGQQSAKAGLKMEMISLEFCQLLADTVIGNPLHPKFNVYDIRIPCETPPLCYDFSQSDTFLNKPEVQEMLGVSGRKWVECDTMVHTYLLGDWMTNLMPNVSYVLGNSDVEVLVYSGNKDWICNWRGGEAWANATKWAHKKEFNEQDYSDWLVDDTPAGALKNFGNLSFLEVYDAGHMVPMDQPKNALSMLETFYTGGFHNKSTTSILQ